MQTEQPGMNYPSPTLHLLPVRERPATRVGENVDKCNLVELLAAVVRGPRQIEIAFALLGRFGDLDALSRAGVGELTQVPGVGKATAASIRAALGLSQHFPEHGRDERFQVRSPADVASLLLHDMKRLEQEELRVIVLDTRNRVLDVHTIYRGNLNSIQVRAVEVFRPAIRQGTAASIIAVHNHPSTDPSPSPNDVDITRVLAGAGDTLGIELLDHVIIGAEGRYTSLKERGLGFS
jgi:DNA repair protein RadC